MTDFSLQCPIPIELYPKVLLAHGGGGRLMHQLLDRMIKPILFKDMGVLHDASVLSRNNNRLAFTTDSYVVDPLFFPGGDIGKLAVYGTVNDLAMAGAKPLYLSLSLILEEGFAMESLWRIIQSIDYAAKQTNVKIVTGDTKVVENGKGDGLFINTSGIGELRESVDISASLITSGDTIIVNGDLGRHGIAIMSKREGLEFDAAIESDCAPLHNIIGHLIENNIEIHCLRDITRGGLSRYQLGARCQ
ncbi:hydrogenase expression/formation protein HypE, partial [Pseudomonadota bacterium]